VNVILRRIKLVQQPMILSLHIVSIVVRAHNGERV